MGSMTFNRNQAIEWIDDFSNEIENELSVIGEENLPSREDEPEQFMTQFIYECATVLIQNTDAFNDADDEFNQKLINKLCKEINKLC